VTVSGFIGTAQDEHPDIEAVSTNAPTVARIVERRPLSFRQKTMPSVSLVQQSAPTVVLNSYPDRCLRLPAGG